MSTTDKVAEHVKQRPTYRVIIPSGLED